MPKFKPHSGMKKRVKITDVQTMVMQGPRTYTLVKVVTDTGLHGIAEVFVHEPGPVVEANAAQLEADEHASGVCLVPTPPPPRLDGDICVAGLIGGSERHVDPAD